MLENFVYLKSNLQYTMFLNIAHYQSCSMIMIPFCLTKVPPGLTIQVSDPGSSWSSCFKFIFFKIFFQEHYQCVKQEWWIQRGLREFAWTPHSDQIISFSWRYLRKMRSNQQTKLPLFTYEPPLQKSWISPFAVWIKIRTNILTIKWIWRERSGSVVECLTV